MKLNMLLDLTQKKIGVLLGGDSHERAISLLSGNAIFNALQDAGMNVVKIDVDKDPRQTLEQARIDCAFIALHGRGGEDGTIQQVLEELHIPYTGSDARSSLNAFDKIRTKRILQKHNIPTPRFAVVTKENWKKKAEQFQLPLFIKPVDDGSSIGVFLISSYAALEEEMRRAFTVYDVYLIEERITGREITVGILHNRALPIIELRPKNTFYDYHAKYTAGKTEYLVPASFSDRDYKRYQKVAVDTHRVLGARDFSRVDMMIDEHGNPFVLELNSIPGFTQLSLLPKAAHQSGINFGQLCIDIVQSALGRSVHGRKKKKKSR